MKTCPAAASFPPVCICTWSRGRRIDAPAAGGLTLTLTCRGKQMASHKPGPSPTAFHLQRREESMHPLGAACGPQPEAGSSRVPATSTLKEPEALPRTEDGSRSCSVSGGSGRAQLKGEMRKTRSAALKRTLQQGLQCLCGLARLVFTCIVNPRLQSKPKTKLRKYGGRGRMGSTTARPSLELWGACWKGGLPRGGRTRLSQHRPWHPSGSGQGQCAARSHNHSAHTPPPRVSRSTASAPACPGRGAEPPRCPRLDSPRYQPAKMPQVWGDLLYAFQVHLNERSAPRDAQRGERRSSRGCLGSPLALAGSAPSWTDTRGSHSAARGAWLWCLPPLPHAHAHAHPPTPPFFLLAGVQEFLFLCGE